MTTEMARCKWQDFNVDRSRWHYCEKPWLRQCKEPPGLRSRLPYFEWIFIRNDYFLGWEQYPGPYQRTVKLRAQFTNLCSTAQTDV